MTILVRNIANVVTEAVEKSQMQKINIARELGLTLPQLSRYLSGKRPFDLKSLDGITELLGLSKGYFYDEYIQDCWHAPRNRNSRIENFLWHTKSNGKEEYTSKMVNLLLDSGKGLDDLYKAGENFYKNGMNDEALYFFNLVIENERNRLAECLALSYYRRFMIVRDWDMDYAFEAATKLGEHVRTLSGKVMYEAYINIMTIFYVLDKWEHLLKYGYEVSSVMERSKDRDLFLYAKCLSYLGFAYRHNKQYDKALETHKKCGQLPGETFKIWEELNCCVVLLESGQQEKVYELINLTLKYKSEAPNHLDHIFSAFVKRKSYDEMDSFLPQFANEIKELFAKKDPYNKKRAIRVRLLLADFYINQGRHEEAAYSMKTALHLARQLRLTNQVDECIRMLNRFGKNDIELICSAI